MRCSECKGILFVFDEQMEKDKTQQKAIKRYLKKYNYACGIRR